MKKFIVVLAVALLSFSTFAEDEEEGLSVSGQLRAGMTAKAGNPEYSTVTWMDGGYFGGDSRLRVDIDYTKDFGGVTFRYENSGLSGFNRLDDDIKWAMAFADFYENQIVTEAGIIHDRFTTTGGWEDTGIDGGKGIRFVFKPNAAPGLTLAAQITDLYADTYKAGDSKVVDGKRDADSIKFNADLFGASAKYEAEGFFATTGFVCAGYFYASFGLTSVENLIAVAELFYNDTDRNQWFSDIDVSGIDKSLTTLVLWAEYTGIEKVLLGAYAYLYFCDGEQAAILTPALSYDLSELITLSAEASIYYYSLEGLDGYATLTPGITFNASDKASATVSATLSTDTDSQAHSLTAGVKYKF